MELIDNLFSRKIKKQEKLLIDLGLSGQIKKDDYVGPDFKKGNTLDVKPEEFLRVVEERNIQTINAEAGRGEDTQIPYGLFAEVDESLNLYIKAGASALQYYKSDPDEYQTLLPKLHELGFRWDPLLYQDNWSVYRKTD